MPRVYKAHYFCIRYIRFYIFAGVSNDPLYNPEGHFIGSTDEWIKAERVQSTPMVLKVVRTANVMMQLTNNSINCF